MLVFLDVECYPNLFYIGIKDENGDETRIESPFKSKDRRFISRIFANESIVTFNGVNYDIPMISAAMKTDDTEYLYRLSDRVITSNVVSWKIFQSEGIRTVEPERHYDLFRHIPMKIGLKACAARIGSPILRNLPYEPGTVLTEEEKQIVREYCMNDIELLVHLFKELKPVIKMKIKESSYLKFPAYNLSDSQIGEKVFKNALFRGEVKNKSKQKPYIAPKWAKFENESFKNTKFEMELQEYVLTEKGKIQLPATLNDFHPKIQNLKLKVGIGGLHSQEKKTEVRSDKKHSIALVDAASYYPNLIHTLKIEPEGFHGEMLKLYKILTDSRIESKEKGETERNNVLKIVINSAYGKLLNRYSILYSPYDGINVTLSGQLGMMLLAEYLEQSGAQIHSINTDGVLFRYLKLSKKHISKALKKWEKETQISLDFTEVKNAWLRDVNNYLFQLPEDKWKGKGVFAPDSLSKSPQGEISVTAARNYLFYGSDITETIENEIDIRKFMHVRSVKGSGVWTKTGEELGKVVRWGWSENGAEIHYKTNGNKVPKTDSAWPVMNLRNSDFIPHIGMYRDEAVNIIEAAGGTYE